MLLVLSTKTTKARFLLLKLCQRNGNLKKNALPLLYRANSREIRNTLNILSGSFIIYSLKRAISDLIFILLLVFYYSTKITLGVVLALLYKRPVVSIDRRNFSFVTALRLRQLRVKLISRVVKECSDSLFPDDRRLISL